VAAQLVACRVVLSSTELVSSVWIEEMDETGPGKASESNNVPVS
jgi:hypothetical protein